MSLALTKQKQGLIEDRNEVLTTPTSLLLTMQAKSGCPVTRLSRGRNICADSGVSLDMRKRWRVVLPVIGIILFSGVSYHSFRLNRHIERAPSRYFWWSSIRLDSDPSDRRDLGAIPCKDGKENCWELRTMWVEPSLLEQFLMLSALPAFTVGGFAVRSLGRMGINQVSSFMFLMPVLICAWYYLIGWLLDSWISRRSRRRTPTPTW